MFLIHYLHTQTQKHTIQTHIHTYIRLPVHLSLHVNQFVQSFTQTRNPIRFIHQLVYSSKIQRIAFSNISLIFPVQQSNIVSTSTTTITTKTYHRTTSSIPPQTVKSITMVQNSSQKTQLRQEKQRKDINEVTLSSDDTNASCRENT